MMHAARLTRSDRLRRVLAALRQAGRDGLTTWQIVRQAGVCAVNSIVAELRANGYDIRCQQESDGHRRVWRYTLAGRARRAA